jgi:hypothetical protein
MEEDDDEDDLLPSGEEDEQQQQQHQPAAAAAIRVTTKVGSLNRADFHTPPTALTTVAEGVQVAIDDVRWLRAQPLLPDFYNDDNFNLRIWCDENEADTKAAKALAVIDRGRLSCGGRRVSCSARSPC